MLLGVFFDIDMNPLPDIYFNGTVDLQFKVSGSRGRGRGRRLIRGDVLVDTSRLGSKGAAARARAVLEEDQGGGIFDGGGDIVASASDLSSDQVSFSLSAALKRAEDEFENEDVVASDGGHGDHDDHDAQYARAYERPLYDDNGHAYEYHGQDDDHYQHADYHQNWDLKDQLLHHGNSGFMPAVGDALGALLAGLALILL